MNPNLSAIDEAFLDEALDRALLRIEAGQPLHVDDLIDGHGHLRSELDQVVRLALQIALATPPETANIPGYSILGPLGRGGMGTVLLARQDRVGGRVVALKILPAGAAISPSARNRFRAEADALSKLRHPHVVPIYDVVDEPGLLAYSMECVDGRSLAEVIQASRGLQSARIIEDRGTVERSEFGGSVENRNRVGERVSARTEVRGRLPDPTISDLEAFLRCKPGTLRDANYTVWVCRIGLQIARALAAVHEAGLLHRDVKPSNILIRRDGTPVLTDFGLVRETDSTVHTQEGQFLGTASYAAPEQLRGENQAIDARTDVYALGVTLYHALARQLPYAARSVGQILQTLESGKTTPLRKANPKLAADLYTIVSKATEPATKDRYASAEELAEDLERLLNLQPIKARPSGLVSRTLKLARRNKRSLVGALLGAALALSASVAAAFYFLVVPYWVKSHLDEARLTLLHPEQGNAMFDVEFFGVDANASQTSIRPEGLAVALAHYDAALRWAPFDKEIRREREIVAQATQHQSRDRKGAFGAEGTKQEAQGKATKHASPGTNSPLTIDGSHSPSPLPDGRGSDFESSLRDAGLLAFLTGDAASAIDAWTKLDLQREPDAFVHAALGQLYIARGEYARAYPRLRQAIDAFPNVSFLTMYLADAAVQCGDLDKAEQWLDLARKQPMQDDRRGIRGLDRVTADLYAAQGRDEDAIKLYESLTGANPIAGLNHGRLLESQGRLEEAVRKYAGVMRQVPEGDRPRRAFLAAMEKWWDAMAYAERYVAVRGTLEKDDPRQFLELVKAYAEATKRRSDEATKGVGRAVPARSPVGTFENSPAFQRWVSDARAPTTSPGGTIEGFSAVPTGLGNRGAVRNPTDKSVGYSQGVPPARHPSWLRGSVAPWLFSATLPRANSSPTSIGVSLGDLVTRMEVSNMTRWNCLVKLPAQLKDALTESWLSPRPNAKGVVTVWLADIWCAIERLKHLILAAQRTSARAKARGSLPPSSLRRFVAPSLLTAAYAAACPPTGFTGLGDLPGGAVESVANSVSADGSTVVGYAKSGNGQEPFRWRAETGMVGLGTLPGGTYNATTFAYDVSADGSVVVGGSDSANAVGSPCCGIPESEAFRWTEAGGMQALGDLAGDTFWSSARSVSADGTIVNGQCDPGGGWGFEAWYWTQPSGLVGFGDLPTGADNSFAYGMSADGTWMVGFGTTTLSGAGWNEAFRWSAATGFDALGFLPGGSINHSAATDVLDNGSIVIGNSKREPSDLEAIEWTPGNGMVGLGDLPGGALFSFAAAITRDGTMIVGYGHSENGYEAVLWDSNRTIHRVADVLSANGVALPSGWTLQNALGVTNNCGVVTIAGTGLNPNGDTEAWIASYRCAPPTGFTALGDLPGGAFNTIVYELSADGTTVVGRSESASGTEGFRWTAAEGMTTLGDLPGGGFYSQARGVSADGSVITGYSASSNGDREAFRWTQGGGMIGLGDLPGGDFKGEGDEVSYDGSTIVGNSISASGNEAFRWTQSDGMVGLGFLPGGSGFSNARGVSADGSVIVGHSTSTNAPTWPPNLEAFRWTQAGGMIGLGDLPGVVPPFGSNAIGVSEDGAIVVGGGSALGGYEGFRWTALAGMERLPDLPGGPVGSHGFDVPPDGSPIVGRANGTEDPLLWTAALWDEDLTVHRIVDVLADNGVVVPCGWHLQEAVAIAENCGAVTIAGYGLNPNDDTEGWIASYIPGSDPVPLPDIDGDSFCNEFDNCPNVANANQADGDGDGIGTVCDNCPSTPNTNQADADLDGDGDLCDNCPSVSNSNQTDSDTDGVGNVCDNCNLPNPDQADCNGDFFGDVCNIADGTSCDANGNVIPDECECEDHDACTFDHFVVGVCELTPVAYGDINGTGVVDVDDILCSLDAFANRCNCPAADIAPCNGNGLIDVDDILASLDAFSGVDVCNCGG